MSIEVLGAELGGAGPVWAGPPGRVGLVGGACVGAVGGATCMGPLNRPFSESYVKLTDLSFAVKYPNLLSMHTRRIVCKSCVNIALITSLIIPQITQQLGGVVIYGTSHLTLWSWVCISHRAFQRFEYLPSSCVIVSNCECEESLIGSKCDC